MVRLASVNQDRGIDPRREKGAAVHLAAIRDAFRALGAEVVEVDEAREDRARARLEDAWRDRPLDLIYERYALGKCAAARLARRWGIPFVLEVNAPLAEEADRWRGGGEDDGTREIDAELFGAATHVLAVSQSVADYATRRGAAAHAVEVVPNAVDPRRFRPRDDADPLRAALVPEGRFAIGFHGRLRPWHGLDLLARAAEVLIARGAPIHLVLVGRGEFEPLLAERVPAERRTIVGWQPHHEVGRHVAAFDALALTYPAELPCYFSPLKLREAMACGVVPVVPDVGDLPAQVRHGRDGLVYPASNLEALVGAVLRLVRDPAERASLGREARRAAEELTWNDVAARVLERVQRGSFDRPPVVAETRR